ncbi:membrane-associated progesterone receptor component 1-like [Prorops nasuta]|uniref:membrane-associated progesterone receptor component 1-like n=1 Tax=Prorops nasuta TaxID=863751 RepID=UPI0034CE9734
MAERSESPPASGTSTGHEYPQQFLSSFVSEIIRSPLNLVLVGVIALLVYKILKTKTAVEQPVEETKKMPKLRRDFTYEELKKYNGIGSDGRILIGINGSVYDVTKGAQFYGPNGPYSAFAGKDASRGLATFDVEAAMESYDDLSDLTITEMNSMKEWEEQFKERYDYVGKLLKPGDTATNYSDEEEEGSQQDTEAKSKND